MNRPSRRKDKYNPYSLESNHILSFIDSKGIKQTINLNDKLYEVFNSFELLDLKEMNEYDRHIEHLEQTDELLFHHTKSHYESLEDIVLNKIIYERLHEEIEKLPEPQRRRLKMYYFGNMTLAQISKIDRCSPRAVKYSIDIAIKKLSKIDFKN